MIPNDLYREAKHEQRFVGSALRPHGLATAINRAARRRAEREQKSRGIVSMTEAPPIRVPKPIGANAAVEKTTDMLLRAYHEGRLASSTVGTLSDFVSRFEGTMLARSWERGQPLSREVVRAALAEMYRRGEEQRKGA